MGRRGSSAARCVGDRRTRTQLNVVDATGVLIIARGELSGGTALAQRTAQAIGRPTMRVDLCRRRSAAAHGALVAAWIADLPAPRAVNVAGPPEDAAQPIQVDVEQVLDAAFAHPTLRALPKTGAADDARPTLEDRLEQLYDVRWKDLVFADAKAVAVGVSAASMATAAFLATRPGGGESASTNLRAHDAFSVGVGAGLFAVLLVLSALLPRGEIEPDETPDRRPLAWLVDFGMCWLRAIGRVFNGDGKHDPGIVYYREIAATADPEQLVDLAAASDPQARITSWSHDIRRRAVRGESAFVRGGADRDESEAPDRRRIGGFVEIRQRGSRREQCRPARNDFRYGLLGPTCFYKYRFIRMACVALGVEAAAFAWLAARAG